MSDTTLAIRDLHLGFKSYAGLTEVLHGISLHVDRGERVALVGESGSGKSVTARIVLGLLQETRTARISGRVEFEGRELETMPWRERRRLRGTRMSMIFQDPTSSLNPVYPIAQQFQEVLKRAAPDMSRAEADRRAGALLKDVSIDEPERVLASYPFQLSGGMNQRVMIAMALANEPSLLIADEPGTALDVTVQAQTLALMRDLVEQHHTAVLFISHNLGVVREFADRVYVIYKGRIVEHGRSEQLFEDPRHPYTRALMAAIPRITGGGIPEIADASEAYLSPLVVHEGCGEPEVAL
jgi:peptide/nickel transport system ATP-binding protein